MKLFALGDFEVHQPASSGKAGRGLNASSTIQVRRDNCIVKQFRYDATLLVNRDTAIHKAVDYINEQLKA